MTAYTVTHRGTETTYPTIVAARAAVVGLPGIPAKIFGGDDLILADGTRLTVEETWVPTDRPVSLLDQCRDCGARVIEPARLCSTCRSDY